MLSFIEIDSKKLTLASGQKVIKSEEYNTFLSHESIIQSAKKEAAKIVEEAKMHYQLEKKRGYRDGMISAKDDAAQVVTETVIASNAYCNSLSDRLSSVVFDTVKKVIFSFDDMALTKEIVDNALGLLNNQKEITLQVNPMQYDAVKQEVETLLSRHKHIDFIHVIPLDRIKEAGCIIESNMGIIDATLSVQLNFIKEKMNALLTSVDADEVNDIDMVDDMPSQQKIVEQEVIAEQQKSGSE